MAAIDTNLREAARHGNEFLLKELLRKPSCNVLSKDAHGQTALMWAAFSGHEACLKILLPISDALVKCQDGKSSLSWAAIQGHEACVRLLLPVSDALAKDKAGLTASCGARGVGRKNLAQFIDAYALSQAEQASIEVAVGFSTPSGRAAQRV